MRLDLHNHSFASYDSSNTVADYARAHAEGRFDVLALTDHNTMAGVAAFADAPFPLIAGQEIDTADGELIGLFLTDPISSGRTALDTAREIRAQGGLVYLQHPFYRWIRRLLTAGAREQLVTEGLLDVVEVANGGPLMRPANRRAAAFAEEHGLGIGAGSDAHHPRDIGRVVVEVDLDLDGLTAPGLLDALRTGRVHDRHRSSAGGLVDRLLYIPSSSRKRRNP